MRTLPTTLPGVVLLELDVFGDHRGRFMETFRRDRYLDVGVGVGLDFVQDNFSSSVRGTVRGLHYQLANPQGKLIHVPHGEVWDVAVDIREGSPTFGKWFGQMLSAENHLQMWVPPGFAHGFTVMSEVAYLVYKMTASYAPADEQAIAWNDPALGIAWPIAGEPILSHRDSVAPVLRDAPLPRWKP